MALAILFSFLFFLDTVFYSVFKFVEMFRRQRHFQLFALCLKIWYNTVSRVKPYDHLAIQTEPVFVVLNSEQPSIKQVVVW